MSQLAQIKEHFKHCAVPVSASRTIKTVLLIDEEKKQYVIRTRHNSSLAGAGTDLKRTIPDHVKNRLLEISDDLFGENIGVGFTEQIKIKDLHPFLPDYRTFSQRNNLASTKDRSVVNEKSLVFEVRHLVTGVKIQITRLPGTFAQSESMLRSCARHTLINRFNRAMLRGRSIFESNVVGTSEKEWVVTMIKDIDPLDTNIAVRRANDVYMKLNLDIVQTLEDIRVKGA